MKFLCDSSLGIAIGYGPNDRRFEIVSRQRQETAFSYPMVIESYSGRKRPRHEADKSSQSSAEIKYMWICIYVFMA
jgi:hypothetical protein